MRIGFYQHGAVPAPEVAEHVSASANEVCFRNARYFDERDVEKFDAVVVDEGENSEAIRELYESAGLEILTVEDYLTQEPKEAKPAKEPKEAKPALNADAPRAERKTGKKNGG